MCVISLCTRGALDNSSRGRSTAALGAPVQSIRERLVEWHLSWRAILVIVVVSALVLLIVASPAFLQGGAEVEVTGVVVAPFEMPSQAGNIYYLRVTVDAGEEVRVPIPRELAVRPGKTVVLAKRTEPRLGVVQYRFVRYADAGA
jgi:hypothetical protein